MSIALLAAKAANSCSITTPAITNNIPVANKIGRDSTKTCRKSVNTVRRTHQRLRAAATSTAIARIVVSASISSSRLATSNAGSVTTSPTADTNGAFTSSRSQPRCADLAAKTRVTAIRTAKESKAPTLDRTNRSATATTESSPKIGDSTLVRIASATAVTSDRIPQASTFCMTKVSGRRDIRKVPA